MRPIRLLCVALAILAATLLGAPGAVAEPPLRLPGQVTDHAGALTGSGQAAVHGAIDDLYADRHVRLWVVYVDIFSGQTADGWARTAARLSDLGDHDALLAVATADRGYAFLVSTTVAGMSTRRVDELRRDQIEPALRRGDWSGAAVAAANGLNAAGAPTPVAWGAILLAFAVAGLAGVVLLLVTRRLRRRRRRAELAAARRVDATDPAALAGVRLHALADLSRLKVVEVDNALRTSTNELELAVDEFGDQRTRPFADAVDAAKKALAQAFDVRQQLDNAIPGTPALGAPPARGGRRELLTGLIVAAAKADRELEAQREAFAQLRDLVVNASSRLDALTQQLVELTARIPESEKRLAGLHSEFDAAALASVSGNTGTARDRLLFAERNITRARELANRPVTGQQSELVDVVRAAESALGQAGALLDAVDSAAADIHHAVATLPDAITDIEAGIAQANSRLQGRKSLGSHGAELAAARDAAVTALVASYRSADPLGAFTRLTKADVDLDKLLATLAEEQATAERLARTLEQALFTADSRVRATSDYIDTRRGSIGLQARTRLAEARRRLAEADAKKSTDVSGAITDANEAAALAAQAQSSAKADVQSAQEAYYGRYGRRGGDTGAMLGGIIIGNVLGGGFGRGGGNWSPTSFGGSDSGGGFFGGGGRF